MTVLTTKNINFWGGILIAVGVILMGCADNDQASQNDDGQVNQAEDGHANQNDDLRGNPEDDSKAKEITPPAADGRKPTKQEVTITLFRFADDYDAGTKIEQGDVVVFEIPAEFKDAFGNDAIGPRDTNPTMPNEGPGHLLQVSVIKGEVLRSRHLTSQSGRAIENDPKDGYHQITLRIDQSLQPPNLVPNDRIDLWAAIPQSRSYKSILVMESVEVAAVGEHAGEGEEGPRTRKYSSVTINVKPEQVSQLYDIMRLVLDREFQLTRRAPDDASDKVGTINPEVLKALGLTK